MIERSCVKLNSLEAIDKRISRRSYTGELSEKDFSFLAEEIRTVNLQSGLSISLVENGHTLFGGFRHTYGMFSGVKSFFVLVGAENDPDLKEKIGYYGEHLVLESTKLGLGTCWVGGTFNRSTITRTLKEGQKLVAVIPVGPISPKQTGKEKALYKMARSKHKAPEEIMRTDLTPPNWFMAGVTAASKAPSALNRQPVTFTWDHGVARAEISATEDYEWVDLGIAKLHFEIAAAGTFALGNNSVFTPVGETDIYSI